MDFLLHVLIKTAWKSNALYTNDMYYFNKNINLKEDLNIIINKVNYKQISNF